MTVHMCWSQFTWLSTCAGLSSHGCPHVLVSVHMAVHMCWLSTCAGLADHIIYMCWSQFTCTCAGLSSHVHVLVSVHMYMCWSQFTCTCPGLSSHGLPTCQFTKLEYEANVLAASWSPHVGLLQPYWITSWRTSPQQSAPGTPPCHQLNCQPALILSQGHVQALAVVCSPLLAIIIEYKQCKCQLAAQTGEASGRTCRASGYGWLWLGLCTLWGVMSMGVMYIE